MIKIIVKKQFLRMQDEIDALHKQIERQLEVIEKLDNWCKNADKELHKKEKIIKMHEELIKKMAKLIKTKLKGKNK